MTKTTSFDPPFSSALLSPYLDCEASARLAMQVVFALAPSKVPANEAEFKLFANMVNVIASQPIDGQSQVAYSLEAWSHARLLSKECCYAQTRMFPDVVFLAGYELRPIKTFDELVRFGLAGKLFRHVLNCYPVFIVNSPGLVCPVAALVISYISDLAQPSNPMYWCLGPIVKLSVGSEPVDLAQLGDEVVLMANAQYRPY